MKVMVVLTFDVPSPESVAEVILALDPPKVPYFSGVANVVVEPHASELTAWLNEESGQ